MKMDIVFHYEVNESTGEITYIGKDEITVDTAKKTTKTSSKTSSKKDENLDPIVTLDPNKLVLTQGAVNLLEICADCRVDIKYGKKDGKSIPMIGTDAAFGTKSGNKLTKSNTVSYRGANNERLSAYGTTFKLEATETSGIYYLIGDKVEETPDELVNIENELDIENLNDFDMAQEEEVNLENFDFSL